MQFRLVYKGRLPAAKNQGGSARVKHELRRVFHEQLRFLWSTHPSLKSMLPSTINGYADRFARCGYRFVPLVGDIFGTFRASACALDILFLRREAPGLVSGGGDIDNRMKTLFDALQMPQDCTQVKGLAPAPDEDPFFCLLQNDQLITEVKVTTDQLLTPKPDAEHVNEVQLVILVRTVFLGGGISGFIA